MREANANLA